MTLIQLSPEELEARIRAAVRSEISTIQPTAPDRLVPKKEAAKQLGVSLPTMTEWERTGELPPATRIGSRVYWRLSEIVKL